MKITNDLIKSLNPCQDRLDNYIKFYSKKSHTKAEFLRLKNITSMDKIWVVVRLMSKDNLRLAAADIAESVLHIYEKAYPNDDRPRKAIEVARANKNSYATFSSAIHAASHCSFHAAHAAYAAAYASNINYGDRFYAAIYVTWSAYNAHSNIEIDQRKLNVEILLKYWEKE
jgi:hypothetical protein